MDNLTPKEILLRIERNRIENQLKEEQLLQLYDLVLKGKVLKRIFNEAIYGKES